MVLVLIPGDWTDRAIEREAILVEENLGSETRYWIKDKADHWYQGAVHDSGFYSGAYSLLIPTAEEKSRSRGIETMGDWWFQWLEGRLEAMTNVIYQFFTRTALFLAWAPYMLILLVPAIYDGFMTWRIKRTNFAYASPVMHRYSLRFTGYIIVGLAIAFFSPIAINPVIIPIAMMVCCVLLGISIGNLQKRV